jgi:hypothetical protein
MNCCCCGRDDETRGGVCFECASDAEFQAAQRNVLGHLASAVTRASRGQWSCARIDVSWAWERLTRTGDYKPGGYFAREYGPFLSPKGGNHNVRQVG